MYVRYSAFYDEMGSDALVRAYGGHGIREDSRMRVTRDEHVDVHLPCDGTQRVKIARWDALVAVHDTDADRSMHHRRRGWEAGVLSTRIPGERARRADRARSKWTE